MTYQLLVACLSLSIKALLHFWLLIGFIVPFEGDGFLWQTTTLYINNDVQQTSMHSHRKVRLKLLLIFPYQYRSAATLLLFHNCTA